MSGQGAHERTIAFAEIALSQIKALRQPAEPRDYELWYNYATGYNPNLNKAINEKLARAGNLTSHEVDTIHRTFLSASTVSEQIDTVGTKVLDELQQVMSLLDNAIGQSATYSASLADASKELGANVDRGALRAVIEKLVLRTREFERNNQTLEASLKASKRQISELQTDLETVRLESLTDQLTSLANRKFFDHAMAKACAAATPEEPLTLLMVDIDHFKSFNDRYGHLTGDQVLRLVALCVKQNVKGQDLAARYGGEEFAIILPKTSLQAGMVVADHVRRAVMSKELMKRSTGESLGRVTVSLGVATCSPTDTVQSLIERADNCLYAAKRGGRNKAVSEAECDAPALEARVA
ncbi:MAG: GGDEF domain-containing protein [Variibacter sp.]|nr:GGDEF domain-containing protein [Variibacter sp.]